MKIDEILEKYCKNGVRFYKLDEIVDFLNGKGHEKNIVENGRYIVVNSKFISTDGDTQKFSDEQICPVYKDDILMVMSDLPNGRALAKCFYVEEDDKYTLNQRICALRVKDKDLINTRFLYYYLNRNHQLLRYDNGVDQTNLRKDHILNIRVAVPPMKVQCEIVHILDELTLKIEELNKKLKNELMIRQKQYKYYKEKIICKDIDIEWVPLLSVANTYTGLTYKPSDVSSNGTLVLRSSNIQNNKLCFEDNIFVSIDNIPERVIVKENDILVCVRNGSKALIGKAAIITKQNKKMAFGAFMTILRATNDINSRYLLHVWQSSLIQDMIHNDSGMPINQITKNMLGTIKIPLPSHENQEKIANILDKFDAVFNDFFEKINNEIIYQEKKYKYYMNKLLSFKEVEKDGKV